MRLWKWVDGRKPFPFGPFDSRHRIFLQNHSPQDRSMLTLSYAASEHVALMLAQAEAPDDAVIRLVAEDNGIGLVIDTIHPGDETFTHAEITVCLSSTSRFRNCSKTRDWMLRSPVTNLN